MVAELANKVVLITGGSSGIGRALGFSFGRRGARIAFSGQNKERISETNALYKQAGITHKAFVSDASSEEQCKQLVDEVVSTFGQLDVLIANAGIGTYAFFEDIRMDTFRKVMEINFFGAVYATKYALPYLLKKGGSVIAISSINGYRSTPARSAYTSSKFAMQGFFENLRIEQAHKGLHVLVACPGFTTSNIRKRALTADGSEHGESPRDEKKMMSAESVAEATYRAYRRKKRDLILSSGGRFIVWLTKRLPGLADRIILAYMARREGNTLKEKAA